MKQLTLSIILCLLLGFTTVHAQKETNLSKTQITNVIDSVGSILHTNYVFPEVAEKMTTLMQTNLKKGSYNAISDPQDLA